MATHLIKVLICFQYHYTGLKAVKMCTYLMWSNEKNLSAGDEILNENGYSNALKVVVVI